MWTNQTIKWSILTVVIGVVNILYISKFIWTQSNEQSSDNDLVSFVTAKSETEADNTITKTEVANIFEEHNIATGEEASKQKSANLEFRSSPTTFNLTSRYESVHLIDKDSCINTSIMPKGWCFDMDDIPQYVGGREGGSKFYPAL